MDRGVGWKRTYRLAVGLRAEVCDVHARLRKRLARSVVVAAVVLKVERIIVVENVPSLELHLRRAHLGLRGYADVVAVGIRYMPKRRYAKRNSYTRRIR